MVYIHTNIIHLFCCIYAFISASSNDISSILCAASIADFVFIYLGAVFFVNTGESSSTACKLNSLLFPLYFGDKCDELLLLCALYESNP